MKLFVLVNDGLEQTAGTEIKELTGSNPVFNNNVLEFEIDKTEKVLSFVNRVQSARRVLVSLGKYNDLDSLDFSGFNFSDHLSSEMSFKVEIENVKGNDKRLSIAKQVAGKIYSNIDFKPKLEMKNPDILVVVYFNGKEYFIGFDKNVEELNSRKYRVFAHPGSFKGDLAYYFVRKSGFVTGKKLLVGFCKDGTMAIEAALFSKQKVFAFDPSRQNVTAAKKNSQLASVKDLVDIQKYALDELDVKFSENEFDCLIFQVTTKDENQLNELYYQANYVLKKKGTLLLIARPNWQVSVSDKFKLVSEEEIKKGESIHNVWLLEKK